MKMDMELDDARQLDALFAGEVTHLAIVGSHGDTTEKIARYLNDHGTLSQVSDHTAWIAIVPKRDETYLIDRLASGLIWAQACESIDTCIEHIAERLF